MTIAVSIGDGPARSFLIDTGAELSGVSSELAAQLKLPVLRSLMIVGFAGRRLAPTVRISNLRYGRSSRNDFEVLTFARSHIGADGFLGLDTLADQRIDFDFIRNTMSMTPSAKSRLRSTADDVVVRAQQRHGRLIFSNAKIERVRAEVLLDTGSSLTIANDALRDVLRAKGRLGPTVPVRIMAITGELISAEYAVVSSVIVGDILIHDLPIAFTTVEPFRRLKLADQPAMLLGMDALRIFAAVSIDFRDRRVLFRTRDTAPGLRFGGRPKDKW